MTAPNARVVAELREVYMDLTTALHGENKPFVARLRETEKVRRRLKKLIDSEDAKVSAFIDSLEAPKGPKK